MSTHETTNEPTNRTADAPRNDGAPTAGAITDKAASAQDEADAGPSLAVHMTRMLTGFEVSQALYAVAKLGIATAMLPGPRPVAEIAVETGTHEDALRRTLRTLTGHDVITQPAENVFGLTALGETLAAGAPGSVRDLAIMLMDTHYAPFGHFVETVRTGVPAATVHYGEPFMDWLTAEPERADGFSAAMAAMTDSLQGDVFEGYRLPAGTTVVDLGGADGSVLIRLLGDEPERRGVVFDLATVVGVARSRVEREGLTEQIEVRGGDFFESVPEADVYVLSTILHDWDDRSCARILDRVAHACWPGARLVLVETVLPADDAPHFGKSADLTMLGMVSGRERTADEYAVLLRATGFELDRVVDTSDHSPYSILEATRQQA